MAEKFKPGFKKSLIAVIVVAYAIVAAAKIKSLPAGSITLPIGWQYTSGPCSQNDGWPFLSVQYSNVCEAAGVNNLAAALNLILAITVCVAAVALLLYGARVGWRKASSK